MEQWLPRRPLILAPIIPLIWTVSWLGVVTALHGLGFPYPRPHQLQDSVLIISALIVVANIYNLILIYQRVEQQAKNSAYRLNALLLAIILIISMVLAWGQPQNILLPQQLTWWLALYIGLNLCQALLGIYFVQQASQIHARKKLASLVSPILILTVTGIVLPPSLLVGGYWLLAFAGVMLLAGLGWLQWRNLPGLMSLVAATNSGTYQILVGMNLTTTLTTILFGLDTYVIRALNGPPDLISYCYSLSLLVVGISGAVIAAMQRYNNDYRYGHARGRERWYLIFGMLLTVTFLMFACWLVA